MRKPVEQPGLFVVDCEAVGPCPSIGFLTEFGAVHLMTGWTFHGQIVKCHPDPQNPAVPVPDEEHNPMREAEVFEDFRLWIRGLTPPTHRPVFVSDNPAYDWQWINNGFWLHCRTNPFGHSARRIGDFYAGLTDDWNNQSKWKKLRRTKHDHNPVNDAKGNVEALLSMLDDPDRFRLLGP